MRWPLTLSIADLHELFRGRLIAPHFSIRNARVPPGF
jgi:hypothetical protein